MSYSVREASVEWAGGRVVLRYHDGTSYGIGTVTVRDFVALMRLLHEQALDGATNAQSLVQLEHAAHRAGR